MKGRVEIRVFTVNFTVMVAAEVEVAIAVTDKKNRWRFPNISYQAVKQIK